MLKSTDTFAQIVVYRWFDSLIYATRGIHPLCLLILPAIVWNWSTTISVALWTIALILTFFMYFISGRTHRTSIRPGKYFSVDNLLLTEPNSSQLTVDPRSGLVKLKLNECSSYNNGLAHGYLLAPQILSIVRWYSPLWTGPEFDVNLLPKYLIDELDGIVDGVQEAMCKEWIEPHVRREQRIERHVTREQLIRVCQVADTYSACTCICTQIAGVNGETEPTWVFGRNMDWIPFEMAQDSVLIEYPNGTHLLTAPGIIGGITAWRHNLKMAMNVCPDPRVYNPLGLPTVFSNRILIDTCETVEQVQQSIKISNPRNAYHLTVCDGKSACTIAVYQGNGEEKTKNEDGSSGRDLIRSESPFFVVNDSKMGKSAFLSQNRLNKLKSRQFKSIQDVMDGLDRCKSFETVHSVLFYGNNQMKIGIGNGYSTEKMFDVQVDPSIQ